MRAPSVIRPAIMVAALLLISGAALRAQFFISSYTVDGGGGVSTGDSFVLEGTIGQPDASNSLTGTNFTIVGGFWIARPNPHGGTYAAWAAANIPEGFAAAFDGDVDSDGIANGFAYVFGKEGLRVIASNILTALPPALPPDVHLVLEASTDLRDWTSLLEYTAGVQTFHSPDLAFDGDQYTHASAGDKHFYRYRVELIQ